MNQPGENSPPSKHLSHDRNIHRFPAAPGVKLYGILVPRHNQQVGFQTPFGFQAAFDFLHQCCAKALLAIGFSYCQMVDHAAPPVESSDHRADQFPFGFSNQEQIGITLCFFADFFQSIGGTHVHARPGMFPQVND